MGKHQISARRSITEETEKLLNQQVKDEAVSSATYLSMASWCEVHGFEGSAKFLYAQSDEERQHMLRLVRYINEAGGHAFSPDIPGIKNTYSNLHNIFEQLMENELQVSRSINSILSHCLSVGDYATMDLMNWFVKEQREEETWCRQVLNLFDKIEESANAGGLWLIDRQIGKMTEGAE